MTTAIAEPEASPQAVAGWKKKADHVVALEKELTALEDQLEEKLRPIREKFEPDIERKRADLRRLSGEVTAFGIEHADLLFGEGSEIKTKVSIITGKRTPGSVTVEDGFEEKEVVETCWTDRSLRKYVVVNKRLDKPAIKRALAAAGESVRVALGLAGIILQENFSVKVRGKGD